MKIKNKIPRACFLAVRFSMTACLLLLLVGCRAETPPTVQYDGQNGKKDLIPTPDWPANCQTATPIGPPVLDPYPNPTVYAEQAFRGRCPGGDLVSAKGGAGTAAPAKVNTDGKFCIQVMLLPDSPNTIGFGCIDAKGCPGKETQVTIEHKSAPKQDSGIASPVNLAKLSPVTSNPNPEEGDLKYVNDGDYASSARFKIWDPDPTGSACDAMVWVKIDLGKVYTVSKLKVRWAQNGGDDFGKCYAVLLSSSTNAGDPDTSSSAWKVVKQDSNNADASELLISINPEPARWAALLMYENNSTDWLGYETFRLAELEVWGQDPNATPPPPPDRCQ